MPITPTCFSRSMSTSRCANTLMNELYSSFYFRLQIINWFTQLCLAVHYLKQNKVLHRDIKLSNIFLSKDGMVTIIRMGYKVNLDQAWRLQHFPETQQLSRTHLDHYRYALLLGTRNLPRRAVQPQMRYLDAWERTLRAVCSSETFSRRFA
jgi:serine/threonine protein kinase